MSVYLLFAGESYGSLGGADDLLEILELETDEEATDRAVEQVRYWGWVQVVALTLEPIGIRKLLRIESPYKPPTGA